MIERLYINNTITTCPSNISLRAGEYIFLEIANDRDESIFLLAVGDVFVWSHLLTNGLYTKDEECIFVKNQHYVDKLSSLLNIIHKFVGMIFGWLIVDNLFLFIPRVQRMTLYLRSPSPC